MLKPFSKASIAVLLVFAMPFVLSGCSQKDSASSDATAPQLSISDIKQEVQESWMPTQFLAQASFRSDKHLDLKPVKEESSYRQIAFRCAQDSPSPVSIWLRHGNELRRLAEIGACGSDAGLHIVGLSTSLFPQAEQALFIANDDTRIAAVVFETNQETPL
ncbi:hypothetical protein [uncultured Mobiluncus sp.]|uniref:hypothetical protein n=1 Tax=uncultured Mobiluncus sp. TaxID=293425 RepID=UPI002616A492|nr:hypothetical protein [uncultured Mobiluncus sp.]